MIELLINILDDQGKILYKDEFLRSKLSGVTYSDLKSTETIFDEVKAATQLLRLFFRILSSDLKTDVIFLFGGEQY